MENEENIISLHSPQLEKALKEREDFFAEQEGENLEKLLKLQEMIDSELKKAGNQNNRLTIIHKLMMDSLKELNLNSKKLSESMASFSKELDLLSSIGK